MSAYWLTRFSREAAGTDRLVGHPDHTRLLAAGLVGEAGSILAEMKKQARERGAYPAYRHQLVEEVGDFLWYFVRFAVSLDRRLLSSLRAPRRSGRRPSAKRVLALSLELGHAVGQIAARVGEGAMSTALRAELTTVWDTLVTVARVANVSLAAAASQNLLKTQSRWPSKRRYHRLFDDSFPEEEQLPRRLGIEFRDKGKGRQRVTLLRCSRLNFGDQLTDNIATPDGYRFHDIFHFSYAVHLGWSPVIRSLLRCKRKSAPKIDENEDGRRAAILEEAVSAIVFSRAKHLRFFEKLDHVDYDLLKTVRGFIGGYEVEAVPLWQWEVAIIDGYRVFRLLRDNRGGRVTLDLLRHRMRYTKPLRARQP